MHRVLWEARDDLLLLYSKQLITHERLTDAGFSRIDGTFVWTRCGFRVRPRFNHWEVQYFDQWVPVQYMGSLRMLMTITELERE